MGLGRKPGIIRRPIEYILVFIILAMIFLLLWANLKINNLDEKQLTPSVKIAQPDSQLDINFIAERGLLEESNLDKNYDEWELGNASGLESAADAIGGVYDETTY